MRLLVMFQVLVDIEGPLGISVVDVISLPLKRALKLLSIGK